MDDTNKSRLVNLPIAPDLGARFKNGLQTKLLEQKVVNIANGLSSKTGPGGTVLNSIGKIISECTQSPTFNADTGSSIINNGYPSKYVNPKHGLSDEEPSFKKIKLHCDTEIKSNLDRTMAETNLPVSTMPAKSHDDKPQVLGSSNLANGKVLVDNVTDRTTQTAICSTTTTTVARTVSDVGTVQSTTFTANLNPDLPSTTHPVVTPTVISSKRTDSNQTDDAVNINTQSSTSTLMPTKAADSILDQTVCTDRQRASPHVSPCNSDDENAELVLGANSTAEDSEDDELVDEDSSSNLVAEGTKSLTDGTGRLHKLITHITESLVEDDNGVAVVKTMNDTSTTVALKKAVLEKFYDKIVKAEVTKESFHKDMELKLDNLRKKDSFDNRKLDRVIQEVRSLRKKVKLLTTRPEQRCVSTQISTILAASHSEEVKTLKSRVLPTSKPTEAAAEASNHKVPPGTPILYSKPVLDKPNGTPKSAAVTNVPVPKSLLGTKVNMPAAATDSTTNKLQSTPTTTSAAQDKTIVDLTSDDETPIKDAAKVVYLREKVEAKPTVYKPSVILQASPKSTIAVINKNSSPVTLSAYKTNPVTSASSTVTVPSASFKHPAPLPACPLTGTHAPLLKPPPPSLDLKSTKDGITLQWNLNLTKQHAIVTSYQIFGYKEKNAAPQGNEWKKVGDLKALPLPMACTLTQFQIGHTYHFTVRAVDVHGRTGPFSPPRSTRLMQTSL